MKPPQDKRGNGLVDRVFTNGLGDLGSIPGHVIPKTLKMVLDTSLLNTQQYKLRIKGKVEQFRERVVPSLTPRCRSYWKGSFLVAIDYGCQLYNFILTKKILFSLRNIELFSFGLATFLGEGITLNSNLINFTLKELTLVWFGLFGFMAYQPL